MSDKNWMLNPTAISHARACIAIIQAELGVKLKLSHPQFLEMIKEYIELTDSVELASAYNILASMAGSQLDTVATAPKKVVNLNPPSTNTDEAKIAAFSATVEPQLSPNAQQEMVNYNGKLYPRFNDDGEFKGLYRGQPRYA